MLAISSWIPGDLFLKLEYVVAVTKVVSLFFPQGTFFMVGVVLAWQKKVKSPWNNFCLLKTVNFVLKINKCAALSYYAKTFWDKLFFMALDNVFFFSIMIWTLPCFGHLKTAFSGFHAQRHQLTVTTRAYRQGSLYKVYWYLCGNALAISSWVPWNLFLKREYVLGLQRFFVFLFPQGRFESKYMIDFQG